MNDPDRRFCNSSIRPPLFESVDIDASELNGNRRSTDFKTRKGSLREIARMNKKQSTLFTFFCLTIAHKPTTINGDSYLPSFFFCFFHFFLLIWGGGRDEVRRRSERVSLPALSLRVETEEAQRVKKGGGGGLGTHKKCASDIINWSASWLAISLLRES